ncbi:MAG: hypothetical protein MUE80_06340 [Acidobacteria bacterium]|jgi:hypothetical protein|nr:hypothetical protein [Acidobacteriota bacterium]
MKPERESDEKIEKLLRRALADDLPAEVAAGMRARIARVRAAHEEGPASAAVWSWARRRTVWAVLSVLMLVAGILLQGAAASSPLADRIAALKAAGPGQEQTRR